MTSKEDSPSNETIVNSIMNKIEAARPYQVHLDLFRSKNLVEFLFFTDRNHGTRKIGKSNCLSTYW